MTEKRAKSRFIRKKYEKAHKTIWKIKWKRKCDADEEEEIASDRRRGKDRDRERKTEKCVKHNHKYNDVQKKKLYLYFENLHNCFRFQVISALISFLSFSFAFVILFVFR